ncbi:MAG: polysaccharide biosynthesis/export family protein [Planctomycetaceae bacterium]
MQRRQLRTRAASRKPSHVLGWLLAVVSGGALVVAGCASPTLRDAVCDAEMVDVPRELQKVSIPVYRVEPPDILQIEIVNNIRPAEDPLHAGDDLMIRASNVLPIAEGDDAVLNEFKTINGTYRVQTDGTVDLGPEYGSVFVEGMPLHEGKEAVIKHLRDEVGLADPKVAVSLPNVNGKQLIAGEHLVRPDGTVALGVYGSVYVAGMTLDEVKAAVERHLQSYVHDPEVNVDVLAYNSKVIYVITDGGGNGEQVSRLAFVGNETVLDAISQIQGLSEVSSKRMWVARPSPKETEIAQTMLVDWRAITQDGVVTTNYQLMPGDRIYIQADSLIATDNFIAKVTTPVSRLFGFVLLGNGTVRGLQRGLNAGGGTGGGGGFF